MSKTLLIVTLALLATASAKPYFSAYGPTSPFAAYAYPGAQFAALQAAVPAAIPAAVPAAVPAPLSATVPAPISTYPEFAPAYPYGLSPLVQNYGAFPSPYAPAAYGYAYGDTVIYRR